MQRVQAHVPDFKMTPPQLMDMVDEITDRATEALHLGHAAMGLTSGEARDAVSKLLDHVRRIGLAADSSVADCTADLSEVWGIEPADA